MRLLFFQVFLLNHLKHHYTVPFASTPANIRFGGVIKKSSYFTLISLVPLTYNVSDLGCSNGEIPAGRVKEVLTCGE